MGLGDWEGGGGHRGNFFSTSTWLGLLPLGHDKFDPMDAELFTKHTAYVNNLFCLILYSKPKIPPPPPPPGSTKRNLYPSVSYIKERPTLAECKSAATRGCLPRQSSVHTHLEIVFLQTWLLLQCAYKGLAWYLLPAHPLHQLEQQKHNILRTVHRLRSCCL